MQWTEPDWCELHSFPRFHGEIYPKPPDDTPGFTLWVRYDGDGGEVELKALAEKINEVLDDN
jgi:hypothetical protein